MLRILFTGGGTGGHIYPILAVVEALRELTAARRDATTFYYLGAPGAYAPVLPRAGMQVRTIVSSKWRRYFDVRNFVDILKLLLGFFQSLFFLITIRPHVLFSKGGPGSLAVVLACRVFRVPVIIHESDAMMGLTNRLSVPFAREVTVAFRSAGVGVRKGVSVVGNPIRPGLLRNCPSPEQAKEYFGFQPHVPVLLVLGGSQGAKYLNDLFLGLAPELVKEFQILHQTGSEKFAVLNRELGITLLASRANHTYSYRAVPFFTEDYQQALLAADLVVSRASSSLFEFAAFGKPVVLVPFPARVHPHQERNAFFYAETGAGIVFKQDDIVPRDFLDTLRDLVRDRSRIAAMQNAALAFAKPDAAFSLAQKLLASASRR